jgi:hypothetical protein
MPRFAVGETLRVLDVVRNPSLSEPDGEDDRDHRECDERLDEGSGDAAVRH